MSNLLLAMTRTGSIHYCPCGRMAVVKSAGDWVCAECLHIEQSRAFQKVMAGLATGEFKGTAKVKAIDYENYHGDTDHIGVGDSLLVLEERLRLVA